ncbi:hypothetical protein GF337_07870 [candidate division KSB1 bacterium]|nr:hypothetical protein [candidate division KSB1 bacterium]
MKQQLCLVFVLALFPVYLMAADAPVVNNLSMFGVGAKASAFNGAFSAVADDYSAPFWNPAGINFINSISIGGMHQQMSMNRTLDYFSAVIPGSYKNSYGIGWLSFKVNEIEARSNNTPDPDYIFDTNTQLLYFSYGRKLWGSCALGLNAKFVHDRLADTKAIGGSIDVGLMIHLYKSVRVSLVSQDLIANISWDTGSNEKYHPLNKIGLSFKINNVLISSEYLKYANKESWILGAETKFLGMIKLRSGIGPDRWAVGTGLSIPVWNKTYLLVNYTLLNDPFNVEFSQIVDFNIQIF